jgi:hypothetical protein
MQSIKSRTTLTSTNGDVHGEELFQWKQTNAQSLLQLQ